MICESSWEAVLGLFRKCVRSVVWNPAGTRASTRGRRHDEPEGGPPTAIWAAAQTRGERYRLSTLGQEALGEIEALVELANLPPSSALKASMSARSSWATRSLSCRARRWARNRSQEASRTAAEGIDTATATIMMSAMWESMQRGHDSGASRQGLGNQRTRPRASRPSMETSKSAGQKGAAVSTGGYLRKGGLAPYDPA